MSLSAIRKFLVCAGLLIPLHSLLSQSLIPFKEGELYGYKDSLSGEVKIDCAFSEAFPFSGDRAMVRFGDLSGYAFINSKGRITSLLKYDEIKILISDIYLVRLKEKWGLIKSGKTVLPLEYCPVHKLSNNVLFFEDAWKCDSSFIPLESYRSLNKIVVVSRKGSRVVPIIYDEVKKYYNGGLKFEEGKYIVKMNNKWGVIDSLGLTVTPLEYDDIENITDGFSINRLLKVRKGKKCGFLNKEGKEVILPEYDYIEYSENNFTLAVKGKKVGLIKSDGKVIIPVIYNAGDNWGISSDYFEDIGLAFFEKEEKYGCFDTTGQQLTPFKYDQVKYLSKNLVLVKTDTLWGILDNKGKEITPPLFSEEITFFWKNIALIKQDSLWGYIDSVGKYIIPPKYEDAYDFYLNRAVVCKNKKFGYIDMSGKEVIECQYDDAHTFYQSWTEVKKDSLWGIIDLNGKSIVPCIYSKIDGFRIIKHGKWQAKHYEFIKVKKDSVYGLLDSLGNEILPPEYNDIYFNNPYSEDTICFLKKNGKYGVMSLNSRRIIIPVEYDSIDYEKSSKYILTRQDSLWGLFDKNGNKLLPCFYDNFYFADTYIFSTFKGKSAVLDSVGNKITDFIFDWVWYDRYVGFIFTLNGKYGWLDWEGKVIIEPQFDEALSFEVNLAEEDLISSLRALVRKGDKHYLIDRSGKVVMQGSYKKLKKEMNDYYY